MARVSSKVKMRVPLSHCISGVRGGCHASVTAVAWHQVVSHARDGLQRRLERRRSIHEQVVVSNVPAVAARAMLVSAMPVADRLPARSTTRAGEPSDCFVGSALDSRNEATSNYPCGVLS
jgi:hypothetical protein